MYPYVVVTERGILLSCKQFLMLYIFLSFLNSFATHHNENFIVGEDSNNSNSVALTGCRNYLLKQVTIVI